MEKKLYKAVFYPRAVKDAETVFYYVSVVLSNEIAEEQKEIHIIAILNKLRNYIHLL